MEPQKYFVMNEPQRVALFNYLATLPYKDVAQHVNVVATMPPGLLLPAAQADAKNTPEPVE